MKSPIFVVLSPPLFPRKSTAAEEAAGIKSIPVAAIAIPIPKLRMVMVSDVADWAGIPSPIIWTPNRLAIDSTT
ncbi:MAG: hypothetical protein WCK15_08115 [Pirellula sp.]